MVNFVSHKIELWTQICGNYSINGQFEVSSNYKKQSERHLGYLNVHFSGGRKCGSYKEKKTFEA